MKTTVIRLQDTDRDLAAKKAAKILNAGGIVAFPTDTVYGLGAVFSDAKAVRKIFAAKQRPENKPLSILISDISQVHQLAAQVPEAAYRLMEAFWPGALTLIFRKHPEIHIPDEVTAGTGTIGLRMPDSDIALRIINAAGVPLAAPSANLSGQESSTSAQQVLNGLDGRIDMLIDDGECPIGVSSTIIDMSLPEPRVLRTGSISLSDMEEKVGIYGKI